MIMHISQHDIAQMTDNELKIAAVLLHNSAARTPDGDPVGTFWLLLSRAVIRAVRARRQAILLLEADAMNPDEVGELVDERPGRRSAGRADGGIR